MYVHNYENRQLALQICLKNTNVNVAYIMKNAVEANKNIYSKFTYVGKGTT